LRTKLYLRDVVSPVETGLRKKAAEPLFHLGAKKMDLPEAREKINLLFDFYAALLTQRQREIFTMHYIDDCSLAEIGKSVDVSPQAVADMLKRTTKKLHRYEKLLGLAQKFEHQHKALEEIKILLEKLETSV
jgi:hypothetical protein